MGKGGRRGINPAGCRAAGGQDGAGPRGMLGTGGAIRKCIDRMQKPHLGCARWPCSPCTEACSFLQSTRHTEGVSGTPQGLLWEQGSAVCPRARIPRGATHPQRIPARPWSARSPAAHAHTPGSCSRRPGRGRVGPKAGLPLFSPCLLPPAGSSGHRERAKASLLPHLQHIRAGKARCSAELSCKR